MNATESGPVNDQPDEFADVRELLAAGNKIGAIKRLREHTDWGLAKAKQYVDALQGDSAAASGAPPRWPNVRWATDAESAARPPWAGRPWVRWGIRAFATCTIGLAVVYVAEGRLIEAAGQLAFGIWLVLFGGFRFGLRAKAVAVVGWSMLLVYAATLVLRWTGRV